VGGEGVTARTPADDETSSPGEIVPRWEWRTFGESFGAAEGRLALLDPDRMQESHEVYLLSLDGDSSVKIREGLMDVKLLEAVNRDGLEQWRPILKSVFPLSSGDVSTVLGALGVGDEGLPRSTYMLEHLLDEVVPRYPSVRAVEVHKQRVHYLVDGCMVELSEVAIEGTTARTLAVESEDAALVAATVRDLGLGDRPNVCMARGLKSLVGFEGIVFAVVDVGTNSVKLHIAERRPGADWRTVVDRAEVTRLGEGLREGGRLQPEPIRRTVDAVVGMVEESRRAGAAEIAAVGTAAMRIAENSAELIDPVRERCGVAVEVISGEEEARLAYVAATSELEVGSGSLAVFDTGGGSTEFTFGARGRVDERFSIDVGAARITERYGLSGVVSDEELAAALEGIRAELRRLDGREQPAALVGMGGALTNLAAVSLGLARYDADVVHGTVLGRSEISRQIELYRRSTAEERRQVVGLQPARAEVILAGACIVRTVLDKLQCDELTVSDRGLRHGLLVERFGAGS
jgi:exopolyphosphatase/guanosine-5'-triphosphate,3'-diphosphate pyrophosphatase